MKWLERIWNTLKYVLAPIIAYIKGRLDEADKWQIRMLKDDNEYLKKKNKKHTDIRVKYLRIRELLAKKNSLYKPEDKK